MGSEDLKNKFSVETNSAIPLYEQIKREIKIDILSGILLPDEKLPPIREYAKNLKVNPNTIVKVYYQLDIEGFLYSRPGEGYFVKKRRKDENPEDKKMFRNITEEYLKRVTDLGFSIENTMKYLNARKKK